MSAVADPRRVLVALQVRSQFFRNFFQRRIIFRWIIMGSCAGDFCEKMYEKLTQGDFISQYFLHIKCYLPIPLRDSVSRPKRSILYTAGGDGNALCKIK
jgi:hypothetical protein